MKIQNYIIAMTIVLLSTIVVSSSVGSSLVYSSSDDDDDDGEKGNENDPCYNAGFEAGQRG
jgi:hypothetical protein